MSLEQHPESAPTHNIISTRRRLFALLHSTDGRLGLIGYLAFMTTTALIFAIEHFGGWRHPNLMMLDTYKVTSVVCRLMLLIIVLRFLWRFPLWAHLVFTLGILAFFLSACYAPLFTGVEGPFDDAASHLATLLDTIGLVLILLGGFPLMVAAALNKFRLPPAEERHWFTPQRPL